MNDAKLSESKALDQLVRHIEIALAKGESEIRDLLDQRDPKARPLRTIALEIALLKFGGDLRNGMGVSPDYLSAP